MKYNLIYNLATACKRISDNEIRPIIINVGNSVFRNISGNIKSFESSLKKLCESIKEKYPSIYLNLQMHMDRYDSNKFLHQGAIDAIIDCLIAIEEPNNHGTKKIFVSHASADATIVNTFLKEIPSYSDL